MKIVDAKSRIVIRCEKDCCDNDWCMGSLKKEKYLGLLGFFDCFRKIASKQEKAQGTIPIAKTFKIATLGRFECIDSAYQLDPLSSQEAREEPSCRRSKSTSRLCQTLSHCCVLRQRRATSLSSQVSTTSGRDLMIKWKWFERIANARRSIPKLAERSLS